MKALLDFLPLLAFFVAYKLEGIAIAIAVLIAATVAVIIGQLLMRSRPSPMQYWTCAAVVVFGGISLLLDDPLFIKLKTSVIFALMGVALAVALLLKKNPAASLFGKLDGLGHIPANSWRAMAWQWVGLAGLVAALNLAVIAAFSENVWVYFKVFGVPAMMTAAMIIQFLVILRRHGRADSAS